MPSPNPEEETQQEWMSRCIPVVLEEGTAKDQEQASAICHGMWRDAKDHADLSQFQALDDAD